MLKCAPYLILGKQFKYSGFWGIQGQKLNLIFITMFSLVYNDLKPTIAVIIPIEWALLYMERADPFPWSLPCFYSSSERTNHQIGLNLEAGFCKFCPVANFTLHHFTLMLMEIWMKFLFSKLFLGLYKKKTSMATFYRLSLDEYRFKDKTDFPLLQL